MKSKYNRTHNIISHNIIDILQEDKKRRKGEDKCFELPNEKKYISKLKS